jgi:hypothetical protein
MVLSVRDTVTPPKSSPLEARSTPFFSSTKSDLQSSHSALRVRCGLNAVLLPRDVNSGKLLEVLDSRFPFLTPCSGECVVLSSLVCSALDMLNGMQANDWAGVSAAEGRV